MLRQISRRPSTTSKMLFALLHSQATQNVPTFYYQDKLPRLPVPPLKQTLSKYLKSIEPLLLIQQQFGAEKFSDSLALRQKWALEFESGVGQQCQKRLLEMVETSPFNWFDDNFWLKKAYLEGRAPLLVNSNWWLALQDDPAVPEVIRKAPEPEYLNVWQLRRAAWVIKRLVEFKTRLDLQEIPPDMTRSAPLCMSHYTRMFNMARIPKPSCDIIKQASSEDPNSKKILIMIRNHFYLINPYNEIQQFVGVNEIFRKLQACASDALQSHAIPLSLLSADDRDKWAENRHYLEILSMNNQRNLEKIDASLFAMSLDFTTPYTQTVSPFTDPHHDSHLHHTAYGNSAHNRWFDKTISVFVESNTRLGMMGEHSPCDALIPSVLGDYCVESKMDLDQFTNVDDTISASTYEKLTWDVDRKIENECKLVDVSCQRIIEDSDDSQLWFEDYGVGWIRDIAKLSPDAYIQMALQLAWYEDQGKFTPVYETASTRMFLHGRTEVIRSLSKESMEFIVSATDKERSDSERLDLLKKAIKAHNSLTRDSSLGQGIDRHLMALRLVMPEGESAPIFKDPLFSDSQRWNLSTSGLSSGDRFIGTGFGTPYPDGYGINYLAGGKILKFGIESKRSCSTTSTQEFKEALVRSLQQLKAICERGWIMQNESSFEQIHARL